MGTPATDIITSYLTAEKLAELLLDANKFIEELKEIFEADDLGDLANTADGGFTQQGVRINLVYQEGGGEGEGENVDRVISVETDGKIQAYIRFTGYYASNYGTEWNEGSAVFVEPREVVVTQYFSK